MGGRDDEFRPQKRIKQIHRERFIRLLFAGRSNHFDGAQNGPEKYPDG